jgi:hypothetical protein
MLMNGWEVLGIAVAVIFVLLLVTNARDLYRYIRSTARSSVT